MSSTKHQKSFSDFLASYGHLIAVAGIVVLGFAAVTKLVALLIPAAILVVVAGVGLYKRRQALRR